MQEKMYRISGKWLFIGIIFMLFVSCRATKTVADAALDKNLSAKAIIRNHYKNEIQFKTLASRLRINYTDGSASQSVSVSLRMEKDEVIWLSAPLGVIKAMITPDRVTFYNKLENNYFDGSFDYLSKILGTDLDFEKVQNLLLGEALFDLRNERYEVEYLPDNYALKPSKPIELFKTLFQVDPATFKMASQQISQPLRKRLLEINYKDYQLKNNKIIPGNVSILAIDNDQRNIIEIEFKNVEFNADLSFPYRIPNGFEKIVLD